MPLQKLYQSYSGSVGAGGTAYYVSAADYNSQNAVTAEYIYPAQTTNRSASERVTTTYTYTYWDTAQEVIKTKVQTNPAVPASQNGSGVASSSAGFHGAARDGE